MKKLIFAIIAFAFISCGDDLIAPSYFNKYISKFEREGKKRGMLFIDWDGLSIRAKSNIPFDAYYDPNTHSIFIDTTSNIWRTLPEETMMHELGHAILKRKHTFDTLPNNMYKSVMGNYSNSQYGGWTGQGIGYREEYYYDELFNPNTPAPDWSKN